MYRKHSNFNSPYRIVMLKLTVIAFKCCERCLTLKEKQKQRILV